MNEWTNEWTNERMNEWTNERMNEWTNERMNEWTNERMNEWQRAKGHYWIQNIVDQWIPEENRLSEWIQRARSYRSFFYIRVSLVLFLWWNATCKITAEDVLAFLSNDWHLCYLCDGNLSVWACNKVHVNATWAWLDIKSQKSSQLIVEEDKVYKG